MITLDVERIRQDMASGRPDAFTGSPRTEAGGSFPRRPPTAWVVPYTETWHLRWDGGTPRHVRAVRILGDPKDKRFLLWGSNDGQTWHPIPAIPGRVWAGARRLPEARIYPNPNASSGKTILLYAPNQTRYLRITATPVAGSIGVSDVQFVFETP